MHDTAAVANVLQVQLGHPNLRTEVGVPAVFSIGEPYPGLAIESAFSGKLYAELTAENGETVLQRELDLTAAKPVKLLFEGAAEAGGTYRIHTRLEADRSPSLYKSLYFTAVPSEDIARISPVFVGEDRKLKYIPDYLGNQVPDFSNAGYMGGGVQIPNVSVKATVEPICGDATAMIQAAIDEVSALAPDEQGFRGAVLLKRGTYRIDGSLRIGASGVVVRGEGDVQNGTVLIAAGRTKRTLIKVEGASGVELIGSSETRISDMYVPVGARSFHLESADGFEPGDSVIVRRAGNEAFIREIGMDRIDPRPGNPDSTKQWQPFDLMFDRVVTRVDGNMITVDAPITCPIESRWGGGTVSRYTDPGRIEQVGIEGIRAVSAFDPSVTEEYQGKDQFVDEEHASHLITFQHVKNGWVRQFAAANFGFDVVTVRDGAKWITLQDGANESMVSLITGGRRSPFSVNGQLNLCQRLTSKEDRHAYVLGARVCGPNVFLDCSSDVWFNTIEPHQRWSVGGLFDNVSGSIAIQDRQYYGSGHGWSGAYYVAWNTTGKLVVQKPPTAQNWSFGHVGEKGREAFPPKEQGAWVSFGRHMNPQSLYLQQLEERLGATAVDNIR